MKHICLIAISLIIIAAASCNLFLQSGEVLNDQRFNGTYKYTWDCEDPYGINESHLRDILEFDGTSKVINRRYKKIYNTATGWTYTGDFIGDWEVTYLEFEIRNSSQYRFRELGTNSSIWSSWCNYSFNPEATILRLDGDYADEAFSFSSIALLKDGAYIPVYGDNLIEVENLSASSSDNTIILNWNIYHPAIKGLLITRDESSSYYTSMFPLIQTYTVAGLENYREYLFKIQTVDLEGDYSNGVSINATPGP